MAQQPRILVVDDEEVILLSVCKVLKKDDYAIDTVLSAAEALDRLASVPYDVVITDLMMPGMTGLELLDKIAETKHRARAVMITGYATMKTAMQAMQKGAFDYVAKPFTKDELRSVVARAARSVPGAAPVAPGAAEAAATDGPLAPGRVFTLRNHSWARIDADGKVTIGMAPTLLASAGSLLSIEVPAVGDVVEQGKACARLTAQDAQVHVVWCPLSGRVTEVNAALRSDPRLAKEDPLGRGWLARLDPLNLDQEIEILL
jgi:CheY-like chemotaxis protein/glycine cleavage system H lipoate-binding protein